MAARVWAVFGLTKENRSEPWFERKTGFSSGAGDLENFAVCNSIGGDVARQKGIERVRPGITSNEVKPNRLAEAKGTARKGKKSELDLCAI